MGPGSAPSGCALRAPPIGEPSDAVLQTAMSRFALRAPRDLAKFIAPKGSITLDGVSLTVNTVDQERFTVLIIPHTLSVTTLHGWQVGAEVNIEVDLMARYAARLTEMK